MYKILVVEDELFINENICEILQMNGYETKSAYDGKEGIVAVHSFLPQLVICDIMMPEMDGIGFLKALREIDGISLTPVIFLTARQEKSDIRLGMNLGADDYLPKPFEIGELINSVQSCLRKIEKVRESIEKEVDTVVSMITHRSSHEFNTPLNGIIASAELILSHYNQLPKETVLKLLNMIVISGYRLKNTLDKLLLHYEIVSSYEQIKVNIAKENTIISFEKIEPFLRKEFIQKYRANDFKSSIEIASIQFSNYFLEKIIRELLNNAFNFSKEGQLVQIDGKRENDLYVIRIIDHGIGLKEEQIKNLRAFQQFNRNKMEQQGSGLGLYIAITLMSMSGHPLEINSTLGKMTEIILKFKI